MAKKFKPTTASRINESTDFSVSEIVRSKIIKYAQDRLNKSGAVLLAPVDEMITFDDPMDGMISFYYLDTIAESEEESEDASGYSYIEEAVSDIADFIQKQGYILDDESDDPLIFIDENYDEEDEELDDMNESVKWTETDEPNQWVNKLTKNKEAIDPITLECKDLGVALFASKLSEDADNNFYKVMIVNSYTGKSMTKTMPFDGIDLESAISKLKKCDNKDDLYDTISKYLFLRKSDVAKLFSTSMNESASITKTDNYDEFNLLPPGNKFMDPIKLENEELGIWATAGVMFDEDDPDNEDDYSAVVLVSPLDPKYENYVVAGDFSDNYSAAKNIMKKLAQIKTPEELAKIIKDKKFSDYYGIKSNTDFLVDVVRKLYSKMNESTVMNEATSIKKSDRYKEFNLLPKGKGWMDPVELTNKDAGFYAIAGTIYDKSDRDNEDEWGIVVILAPLDEKYEDVVITGSFYDYEEAADSIMSRLSRAKTPSDVARIIKNQDFYDDYDDDESEFLTALTKSYSAQNESTMIINESAQIRPCDPALEGFDLLDSNNPFDFEPVHLENEELGFYAIAGVATGANPGAVWVEDDCSIEICITALDPDYTDEVLVAEYYDVDYKAMNVMEELASATSYNKLTSILVKEGFQGINSGPFDFVDDLEAINSMNEATEVPDGRMTVELDDTDVVEGDTLLLAELTDDVFNAVNTVLDELDPDADVEITIDNEDLLQLAVVSDEDLDDDAFDQVLSELLEDMDLEDIVADMTDSEPIDDPDDEDFGRVIQYINFYPATGATVVPEDSVMDDNIDVIEDEDVINESTAPDYSALANKVKDCIATYYSDGVVQRASVELNKNKDSVICVDVKFPNRDGVDAKQAKEVSKLVLSKFDNLRTLSNKKEAVPQFNTRIDIKGDCLVYYVMPYNNARPGESILARYNFVVTNSSMNESTDVYDRISHYVDDLNFKSGVKFLEGEDKIEKVLKAISPKLDIRFYGLDKLPWTTYKIDGRDKVAVFGISSRLFTPMCIAIADGKNISDFISNSDSILVFANKKLQDWNNVVIPVRIMNNLAKVTDRASEYKAIKSLLTSYQKQVYNYEQFDESVDPIYESYYKDTDEDLSIDQATINKALKAIDRILTKAGYHLDDLDKVYRFNYPRPGLVEISLIPALKSTYGLLGNEAYAIDDKIEKKLRSLNITYCSRRNKSGKDIYKSIDKLVNYGSNDIAKYIKTGKVPDRQFSRDRVSAVRPKLEEIAKDIDKYVKSHPKYKEIDLEKSYEDDIVHVGADYISIKFYILDMEEGKDILIDTNKYIRKNYKELYAKTYSTAPDKKYQFINYSEIDFGDSRPIWSEYEFRDYAVKGLMNESVDDDNSEAIGSYDYSESAKSPKLPTQSELKTIIQKSMIKFGERHTQVTVHAYRTSKYEGGVVEVDLDGTSLATDGREEDYYDEDNIKNALEYAAKELVEKFGQDKDLLDYIDVQYNKVGSLTITFSLDSELNESYSMNEATKVTFHFDDQKDWVSPEDFKKIEKFAPKMEDALERYLRRLRDLGPDDKLKDQVYTEIRVENKEKIIIETKTKKKVLKKDIDRLYAKGNGPSPSTNLSQLPLEDVKATSRGTGWGISPIDKSLGIFVYTGFKALAEPWDPAKAKAEWDAAHPKKPASALKSKLEEIAKGIEEYVKSHPDYKKFNLSKDVVHVGEDYIQITVDTPDVEVGKSILIDTDKFISKNYKDLETHSKSKDGSKPVWSVYVMKSSAAKDLMNESTKFDFDNLEEVLEEDLESDIDLPDYADNIIVSSYPTGQGYGVKATFDDRLVKDNKLRIISRIVKTVADRCGKDYDLDHHHDKMRGEYSLTLSYKGSPFNECAIIGPEETDIDTLRANELSRALNSDQPLVDPYDIRCTIRPVFVRKDQFLFDGSTVYKATANASTDKDSGTTEIKVDVLLSNDPDISDASMTLTLPTEFDGLKLLRGNPTKVYNESADVKADTVTLSFANEDEANEFIKDNGVQPEKSFEGKFGWTVILKKSDLKKIK